MTRLSQFAAALAVATVAALPLAAQASDPTDIIDYRKHVMKSLGEQSASMAMTLQGKAPAENFVLHAETLAIVASTALQAFKEKVEGGGAKPDVWAKWPDFEKRMNDFVAKTELLAKSAKTGGVPVVMEMMVDALTCKGCHDIYREKK